MATSSAPSGVTKKRVFIPAADTTDSLPTGAGAPVLASVPARNPSALHQPADKAGQQSPPPSVTQPVLASGAGGTRASPTPHNGIHDVRSTSLGRESDGEDGDTARSDQDFEKKSTDDDATDMAISYNDPGSFLLGQGKQDDALTYYRKALAIQEQVLGTDHIDTAATYQNIGLLLKDQGKHEQALGFLLKTLAIHEQAFGPEHVDTAMAYHDIGSLFKAQGHHDDALAYYLKAVASLEKVLGTDHVGTATSYYKVGSLLTAQGKHDQALEYYGKSLAICVAVLGTDHADTATSYNSVGETLQALGRSKEARMAYEQALNIAIALGDLDALARYGRNIASLAETRAGTGHAVNNQHQVDRDHDDRKEPVRQESGRTKASHGKTTDKDPDHKEDAIYKQADRKEPGNRDADKCLVS